MVDLKLMTSLVIDWRACIISGQGKQKRGKKKIKWIPPPTGVCKFIMMEQTDKPGPMVFVFSNR